MTTASKKKGHDVKSIETQFFKHQTVPVALPEAFTSPQDRWKSTPLQDAIRAGHTDCARLLAFTGGFLGPLPYDSGGQFLDVGFGRLRRPVGTSEFFRCS